MLRAYELDFIHADGFIRAHLMRPRVWIVRHRMRRQWPAQLALGRGVGGELRGSLLLGKLGHAVWRSAVKSWRSTAHVHAIRGLLLHLRMCLRLRLRLRLQLRPQLRLRLRLLLK